MLSKLGKTVLVLTIAGGIVGCSSTTEKVQDKPKTEPKVEQKSEPVVDMKAVHKQRAINYLNAISTQLTLERLHRILANYLRKRLCIRSCWQIQIGEQTWLQSTIRLKQTITR
ncbi:hypothetical protein PQE66_gp074 [Bacillus phage PBC2]|uniref:Lipoprotein n=1 Tax=Bacillus phage PBC2 TaxID=1675029 RepID=A0A218KBW2_9CAUD|nr:hypothetical protein PQE66_gp074 [Bacillus phage PBC2]AKQ08389.1 hypothetical protein PBC2_074 [Bacillus phage PBC2]